MPKEQYPGVLTKGNLLSSNEPAHLTQAELIETKAIKPCHTCRSFRSHLQVIFPVTIDGNATGLGKFGDTGLVKFWDSEVFAIREDINIDGSVWAVNEMYI